MLQQSALWGAAPHAQPQASPVEISPDPLTAVPDSGGLPPEIEATLRQSSSSTPQPSPNATPSADGSPTPSPVAAATPKPTATPSRIEQLLSDAAMQPGLTEFGYDVFDGTAGKFAPIADQPAGPDYVVGPGDRFTLSLWGKINGSFPLTVGPDGKVVLPRAGAVTVWGQTLEKVQGTIHSALDRQYGDVSVALTPERLRTISVYVVGEVARPGTYSLPSYATAYAALAAAGGPTRDGSLRAVTLRRRGEAPRTFDLYQFLLAGDRSADVRLQPGDTLHVDVVGRTIAVVGEVKRPGIYELPAAGSVDEAVNLKDALELGGGRTAFGDLGRVQILRIDREPGAPPKRIVIEVSPDARPATDPVWKTPIYDGDVLRVFQVLPEERDVVYLTGHVRRPGPYAFHAGMTVKDLVSSYDALLPEPYLARVEIRRVLPPDDRPDLLACDLGKLLDGDESANVALADRDQVRVFSREEMDEVDQVAIDGEVRRPGSMRLTPGLTVRDLVLSAGSVKPSAEIDHAELVRTAKGADGKWTVTRREISLRQALAGEASANLALEGRDVLFVRQADDWPEQAILHLRGEVMLPGDYAFTKGEKLSSVLARAGGFTSQAYLPGAFFTRESARELQKQRLDLLELALERSLLSALAESDVRAPGRTQQTSGVEKAMAGEESILDRLKNAQATGRVVLHLAKPDALSGTPDDVLLENGDDLFVPKRPSTVHVVGEVYNPGASVWEDKLTVGDAVDRVGGIMPDGNARAEFVVRADGTVLSRKHDGSVFHSLDGVELEPGDAVIVPQKVRRFSGWQASMDTTQLLFNLAVTTGVILAAF